MTIEKQTKSIMKSHRRYWDEREKRKQLEGYVEHLEKRIELLRRERDQFQEKLHGNNTLRMAGFHTGMSQEQILDLLVKFLSTEEIQRARKSKRS